MEGTNLHIINGTVVKKPELKVVSDNKQVANFSVACNHTYTNKNSGEKTQDVQYINVECWGKLATLAEKYFEQGTNVHIRGEVRTDKWTAEDGTNRYRTKTLAQVMTFLPSGGRTVSAEDAAEQVEDLKSQAGNQNQAQGQPASVTDQAFGGEDDEDLPF